jgi:hypothetical protein
MNTQALGLIPAPQVFELEERIEVCRRIGIDPRHSREARQQAFKLMATLVGERTPDTVRRMERVMRLAR